MKEAEKSRESKTEVMHWFQERKQKKLQKLQTFDSSYFFGKGHYEDDGMQNYLVFQPVFKYFKTPTNRVIEWESKGLSKESIKPSATSDNSLNRSIN